MRLIAHRLIWALALLAAAPSGLAAPPPARPAAPASGRPAALAPDRPAAAPTDRLAVLATGGPPTLAPDHPSAPAPAPAPERLAATTPERLAASTPERLAAPTPERLAAPAPERLAAPTPERLAAPTPERLAAPTPERLAALARGVNITNWFRFPPRADDSALRDYLDDAAIAALRRAGFSFVRLAVQPELLDAAPQRLALLVQAVRRLQRAGLAVVLGPHPTTWHLEQSEADRLRLLAFWRRAAPALRPLDPALTYPEILNEPVFAADPQAWATLQEAALATVRAALPDATVVLTGANWGGVDGLVALRPVADPNVVYSFHFYEPSELTALAAYRPGLDRAALARLPFPMDTPGAPFGAPVGACGSPWRGTCGRTRRGGGRLPRGGRQRNGRGDAWAYHLRLFVAVGQRADRCAN